jgi:linoleoyl-CoA desaturase
MAKFSFNNKNNDFFNSLKKDVDNYFNTKKIAKTGDWRLYLKTFIILSTAAALYTTLVFFKPTLGIAIPLCIALGLTFAGIGFNIMHDANHGSYSPNKNINFILGLTADVVGVNSFMWRQKHNVIHHTYTNVDNIDDDIAKSPAIRQCSTQRWVPAHKYQHIYLFGAYALSATFWILGMDFAKYFTHKINGTQMNVMKPLDHIIFWSSKSLHFIMYLVLPIYFCGAAAGITGYFITFASLGLTLALVFQLAHVVEETKFEYSDKETDKVIESAWAIHQINTTANFAPKSKIINWYVGGLNYQVEHHLFPKISHVHYPAIAALVENKCKEFGLTYNSMPTMWNALKSHLSFMKSLGQKPEHLNAA